MKQKKHKKQKSKAFNVCRVITFLLYLINECILFLRQDINLSLSFSSGLLFKIFSRFNNAAI